LDGLQRILTENGFDVLESAVSASQLSAADTADEDGNNLVQILLMDGLADAKTGYELAELAGRFPAHRLAVMADAFDFDEMVSCFREGAYGYIIAASSESLVISLRLIAIGEKVMPSSLAEFLPMHPNLGLSPGTSQSMKQAGLSLREIEILACLVSGHPNKIISRQLEISEATVKVHVKAILRKVGVQNRTQAAIWAVGERLNETLSSIPPCGKNRNGAGQAAPQLS
jgi:two-component system nitrate/nitrite response regulator NarL